MQTDQTDAFSLARILDRFLQERNIKWVLAIGAVLLLGSSLMLIGQHWQSYAPPWQYLIMLAYTATIYVGGLWCTERLLLPKTGTMLMGLTLLLLPVLFGLSHWAGHGSAWIWTVLFLPTLLLAMLASQRLLAYFLRGTQPTYLVSYLLLNIALAAAPLFPRATAPWLVLACFGIFTVGAIKVSRHIFWLVESRSAPRLLGFLPGLLLAGQFLFLYLTCFAGQLPLQWFGFGLVLTALPLLGTTDSLTRVFQQRTGDLVRPLPLVIMVPIVVALLLMASGVAVAASGFAAAEGPVALVPSGLVVALLAGLLARRLNKSAFVWMMLGGLLLAYNFSPLFFRELARQLIAQGAQAVAEQRLPYAFYGLTYLPFITGLLLAWRWCQRRGLQLFAKALRPMSIALSLLLLAASLTHSKAILPVGVAMLVVFTVEMRLFARRWLALPTLVSFCSALFGLPLFLQGVFGIDLPVFAKLGLLIAAAAALLAGGARLDALLDRLATKADPQARPWLLLQRAGMLATALAAVVWLPAAVFWMSPLQAGIAAVAIAALGLACSRLVPTPLIAGVTLVFVLFAVAVTGGLVEVPAEVLTSIITLLLLSMYGLGAVRKDARSSQTHRHCRAGGNPGERPAVPTDPRVGGEDTVSLTPPTTPTGALARAFGRSATLLSTLLLTVLLVGLHLPVAMFDMLGLPPGVNIEIPFVLRALLIAWSFVASWRTRNAGFAVAGTVALFAISGAAWIRLWGVGAADWLPCLAAMVAAATFGAATGLRRICQPGKALRALTVPLATAGWVVPVALLVITLPALTWPLRIAGLTATLALWLRARFDVRATPAASLAWVATTWQAVVAVAFFLSAGSVSHIFQIAPSATLWVPLAFVSSAAAILPGLLGGRRKSTAQGAATPVLANVQVNEGALRVVSAAAMFLSLAQVQLSLTNLLLAVTLFGLWVVEQALLACRKQRTWHVWAAQGIAAAAVGYLVLFDVIQFGQGRSMFVLLGVAVGLWALAHLASRRVSTGILAKPLQITARVLPAFSALIGIARHLAVNDIEWLGDWLGRNSLALLLAAGFYVWRAIEERLVAYWLLAAGILNVALMMLWQELALDDAQFYMIPVGLTVIALTRLLHRELPEAARDPLYYLGALIILVSPTFEIVSGSWLHLLSLMVVSVAMVFAAIALRLRALVYTGTAFLLADLVAMIARGSIDYPSLLWLAGLVLGAAVITLGALAERHRELLLQRTRVLTASLRQWS